MNDNHNVGDLTGKMCGHLLVLGKAEPYSVKQPNSRNYSYRWRCRCDCGKETIINEKSLLNSTAYSCGCLRRKKTYCVWNNQTDEVVAIDKTAEECAELMGFATVHSFYRALWSVRRGERGKWCVMESEEIEDDGAET